MKLSDTEKTILAVCELHADDSIEVLCGRTGIGQNSVRYALKKLQARGIIRRVPFVNMYPLGFTDFVVFFSLSTHLSNTPLAQKLNHLASLPEVTWFGELGGQYQYGVAVFVRNVSEFVGFLNKLSKTFEGMTIKKTVRMSKRFTRYNRTFLDPRIPKEHVDFGVVENSVPFDALDEAILLAMTKAPEMTASQQARQIGVADSTWHHRVGKLKERGIYAGHIFAIDTAKLGYTFYNLHIHTNGLSLDLERRLRTWTDAHPHVVHFIECIASWDFEIGVEVEDPQMTTRIVRELYDQFGTHIVQIEMVPIFVNRKYLFFRPIGIKP